MWTLELYTLFKHVLYFTAHDSAKIPDKHFENPSVAHCSQTPSSDA